MVIMGAIAPILLYSINNYVTKDGQMLDTKTDEELLLSLIAEIAKATNELKCTKRDVEKASNRLQFALMVINTMIERQEI
jgi:hypothetical protein